MFRIITLWLICLTFSSAAYLEELKWPKGETFLTFLDRNKLPSSIYYTLDKEEQELTAEIIAGVKYQVLRSEDHSLEQILIPIGEELQLHLRKKDGQFVVEIIPIIAQVESREVVVEINSSPYVDIVNTTNNVPLANEFSQSFKGEVNLRTLHKGDKVILCYHQKRRLGKPFGTIKIDVSMVKAGAKEHYVFQYNDSYYNEKGQELENFLLKIPVSYTRISSPFSLMRWHPILQKYRAHFGIDYAASVGTPVHAAGNGTVSFVGEKSGYGNTVEISHSSSYKTLYGHLNGFAKGLKSGQSVKQGQLVAYVGNTGLSSGPHLHFGLYRNNVAINPDTVVKVAKNALGGKDLKGFMDYTKVLRSNIDNALKEQKTPQKEENFEYSYPFQMPEGTL